MLQGKSNASCGAMLWGNISLTKGRGKAPATSAFGKRRGVFHRRRYQRRMEDVWTSTDISISRRMATRAVADDKEQQPAQPKDTRELYSELENVLEEYRRAPPSFKKEISGEIGTLFRNLKGNGELKKWGAELEELPERRIVGFGDLRMVGVKSPEAIAQVSVRNDAAFLFSVVMASSVIAVVLGQLPGDWGFFLSYLTGGVSLGVLAIGSVNPSILQFAIDWFSQIFPDYKGRVVAHEAAHFLTAYLLGVPVSGYSLMVGKEHTDFAEAALQRRLIERQLDPEEVDRLSVIAMAGATSEAMNFEEVSQCDACIQFQ